MAIILQVAPILIDPKDLLKLCKGKYPGHSKGCPNLGKCDRCPPKAPRYDVAFDLSAPVFAVVNEFGFKAHTDRMGVKHPEWSERQVRCVLYWQGTARKQLKEALEPILALLPDYVANWCPEGMGVDVTATLNAAGVGLEWPPERVARQVALLALPL